MGSVEELFQLSGVRVTDLHKDSVDHITFLTTPAVVTVLCYDSVDHFTVRVSFLLPLLATILTTPINGV